MIQAQRANLIRRVNIILGLATRDIRMLREDAREELLNDLYWALFAVKERKRKDSPFHRTTTDEAIKTVQDDLRRELPLIQRGKPAQFELSKQTLNFLQDQDGVFFKSSDTDFPTMVYETLRYLLTHIGLKGTDLLACANEKCRAIFVPLRRPHKNVKSFCSQKCGNLIAAREYRKKKAEEIREKERERSHKQYEKRVHKKYPGASVGRRHRKQKPK